MTPSNLLAEVHGARLPLAFPSPWTIARMTTHGLVRAPVRPSAAGEARVPWDRGAPNPRLVAWAQAPGSTAPAGTRSSSAPGSGTTPSMSRGWLRHRRVRHRRDRDRRRPPALPGPRGGLPVANLLDPPARWREAFDLVSRALPSSRCPPSLLATRSPPSPAWSALAGRCSSLAGARRGRGSTGRRGRSPAPRSTRSPWRLAPLGIEELRDAVGDPGCAAGGRSTSGRRRSRQASA